MLRVGTLIAVVVMLFGAIAAASAFTVEDLGPRVETLETQVAELRDLHDLNPTPTVEPTATNTAEPDPTATDTPEATATDEPEPTATSEPDTTTFSTWHAPTDHEHGDAPPAWAEQWSIAQFGHGVMFGGDEATPNEDVMKHEAFKGYAFRARADNGSYVDLYVRLHMQTNPHGRSARYHSYEMYARDASGAVSFWQGWLDFGPAPANRDTYNDGRIQSLIAQYEPANHMIGWSAGDNDGYPYSYSSALAGKEFWYAQVSTPDGWEPLFLVDVYDPSTYSSPDTEHLTAMDQATWMLTGDYGLDRRVKVRWIVGGATTMTVSGQPYLARNTLNPRGWFCADVHGAIVTLHASGPSACGNALAQHIAPTMPTLGDTVKSPPTYRNKWACPACEVPN